MTGSRGHASVRWDGVDAVVAAYAGTRMGLGAFTRACHALRQALPEARITLLCPVDASVTDGTRFGGVIEYPSPSAEPRTDQAALEAAACAIQALATRGADAALVFAARGFAPYAPAYLCYLAGIAYRAGFETEFGGAVLSPSLPLSEDRDDGDRHLALLAAVGLEACRSLGSEPFSSAAAVNRRLECDR